jgi:hypothetical protein
MLGKVISPKEFREAFPNQKCYKLTNESENHYGFQYKTGLNVDNNEFNPSGECSKGGLYFFKEDQLIYYKSLVENIKWIREVVTFPKDAKIYVEPNKFKADKFILGELKEFNENKYITYEQWLNAVTNDRFDLGFVPKELRTEEICKIAVIQNGSRLFYVPEKSQTEEICKFSVKKDGSSLVFVSDSLKTYEICKIAVSNYGWALQVVPDSLKTPELCKIAVTENGMALKYVPKMAEEFYDLCKIAVTENGMALEYVPESLKTEEICEIAVTQCGYAINWVPKESKVFEKYNEKMSCNIM